MISRILTIISRVRENDVRSWWNLPTMVAASDTVVGQCSHFPRDVRDEFLAEKGSWDVLFGQFRFCSLWDMMGKWWENVGKMLEHDGKWWKMMGKWWNMMGKWWNMIGKWRNMMKNHEISGRISTWVWLKMFFFQNTSKYQFHWGKWSSTDFWGALFSNNPKLLGAPQWCLWVYKPYQKPY